MTRSKLAVGRVALALGLAGILAVPTTHGVLTSKVSNTTSTARTGLYPQSCVAAARATGVYLAYPVDDSGPNAFGTSARAVSGNNRTGRYSAAGVTYRVAGAPCPRDAAVGVTLDGSAGAVTSPGTLLGAGPQVFSAQVWFRTATTRGGRLVGFGSGSLLGTASLSYDRHVYMTDDGRLVAGVYPNAYRTAISTASYNDNAWHHAVITLGTVSTATGGLRLYVDGVLVASDPTAPGAQVYNGIWRFGFDNLDTWPNQPTSRYVAGSIAHGAVWTTALTPTQVVELYYAGR